MITRNLEQGRAGVPPQLLDERVELRIAFRLHQDAARAIRIRDLSKHLDARHRPKIRRAQPADHTADGEVRGIIAGDEAYQRGVSPLRPVLQAERRSPLEGADRGHERRVTPELPKLFSEGK